MPNGAMFCYWPTIYLVIGVMVLETVRLPTHAVAEPADHSVSPSSSSNVLFPYGSTGFGIKYLEESETPCTCDRCGTHRCDPSTGRCTCKASVEGVKCDRCLPDHWGFSSCQGCSKCLCASASESTSCDLTSGQCRCRPGVTGRACDSCASGFWNYSPTGCQSCNCNSEYADGVGCNPATGQCECLPGVLGPKCDHCPPRWIFIPGEGCRECDECVHDLLDTTDGLQAVVQPIISEFQSIGGMYFMSRKLSVVNESYVGLVPQVQLLTAGGEDVNPLQLQVNDLERIAKSKEIQAENLAARAVELKSKAAKVEDEAKSVESRVKEAIDSAKNIVNDIISLAQGLQVGSGPQVSLALTEAQSLLDEIKSRDLEQIGSDIIPELVKAIDLLKRVRVLDGQVNARVEEASLLKSRFDQLMERLQDLQRQTELSRQRALETLELISNSRAVKVSQDSASAAEKSAAASILLDETEEWLRSSRKLLEATRKQLSALKLLSDRLTTTQRAMKVRYDDTGFAMEDVEDLALRAQQHAADLLIQAQMLDSMMSDTRDASEGAVRAANSYRDIVTAISEALAAAHEALSSAEKAQQLSEGVGQRANQSSEAGRAVLQEATSLLQRVSQQLQPALLTVQIELDQVKRLHDEAARQLSLIDQTFTELAQFQLQERAAAAAERATAAAQLSGQLTARVEAISSQLPLKLEAANELARETESARKALQLATEQVERVEGVVPKVQTIISSFDSKFSTIENMGRDVGDKISELRRKVAVARAKANSINVGVEFDGSVTLRLHNPDGLDLSATSNEISFFFRTSQLNGFLLYLGNEVGTNKNIIRTTSDDFVAVEVVNANINVLVDLGSGTQRVIHNKSYVSDGQWRELQISRKGRHVKVTLVSEDEKGGETTEQVESVLSGSKSALNLDQVWSVLYVGGFPVTAKVQDSVRYTSFTGAIEELRINNVPVGLWNLDSQTNIKNKGAFPRNQLVKFIPASGLRFNGAGYAAFLTQSFEFKERLSVQMSFKTFSKDGLLFLAGRGQTNFVSIELNGGALIYQFSLGDGITTLRADGFYSDGQWHVVDASRQWARGALTVDSITADQAEAAGASSELSVSSMMYFGGYPADVPYDSVMNRNFEGCINDVYVSATNLNLGSNDESLGVVPGCPDRLVSELSFEPDVPGYIVQPVEHDKIRQLSLKFRTSTADGLLVYAVSETQGSSFSLSLNAGNLVLTCVPGGEISTANFVRYNDNLWHIASISVGEDNVRLEIDDYETFTLADPYPGLLLATDSVLFFGGVPDSMRVAERRAGSVDNWAGCLGDVTFNNDFVNFELASVRHNVQLEQCSLQQAADPSQLPSSADTAYDYYGNYYYGESADNDDF